MQKYFYTLFGKDIMAIASVSTSTVLTCLSEVGTYIYKFKNAKNFVYWLRLAPNNKITGGKKLVTKHQKAKTNLQ